MFTLEVCIDTLAGLQACADGAVDRIELCSALSLGGLTPSAGMMQSAAAVSIPTYAMIRPRDGNFCFSGTELTLMCDDIQAAADAGLAGVVLGASTPDNHLHRPHLETLCSAASSMGKTLHRVIDTLQNPVQAVEDAVELGFERILTSGGAASAAEGMAQLNVMRRQAGDRIEIMAGAGLTPELLKLIHQDTGISAFHASCRQPIPTDARMLEFGFAPECQHATDVSLIRRFKQALSELI